MKVVLFALNGSYTHTNLAIRCLRAPLEREGFEVVTVEYNLRDRTTHVLERLYCEKADVYGFSCYIWNVEQMLSLSRALKELRPDSKIIFGGPEVSFGTERFSQMPWVDAIVCGEAEESLPLLCQKIKRNDPFERITVAPSSKTITNDGMLYRDGESTGGILYYESSRGCPYQCAYCLSSATRGVRFRSAEQTIEDLIKFETLRANCKIIKFVDRTFNADVKRANRIWEALLGEQFTKRYHFEVCATLLNEESFSILSRFPKGKIQLEFGLQSTNPETLHAVSRHIDAGQVIGAVQRIYDMGNIHVHLDLIAGLPYESYERFAKSFDEAYGSCHLLQLGFLKLLYGTELRARAEEYGYRCLPNPPYTVLQSNWISYLELQRLSRIAEVLERYLESGRFVHTLWYLTPLMRSPFRFWEGLSNYLQQNDGRALQKISQPDAYRYLLEYAVQSIPEAEPSELMDFMSSDFTQAENKNPPSFLRRRG